MGLSETFRVSVSMSRRVEQGKANARPLRGLLVGPNLCLVESRAVGRVVLVITPVKAISLANG